MMHAVSDGLHNFCFDRNFLISVPVLRFAEYTPVFFNKSPVGLGLKKAATRAVAILLLKSGSSLVKERFGKPRDAPWPRPTLTHRLLVRQ